MNTAQSLQNRVRNTLVSYPDFPKPGILFKDLSELNINKECADIILNYIDSGNIQEEQILSLIDSDKEFLNILESAVQNSQQDSEEESEEKQELQQ